MKDTEGFWSFAIAYHEREPMLANIAVLIVVSTAPFVFWLRYLNNKAKIQMQAHKNIMKYKQEEKDAS